jgi:outer membrane protein OmpA-like peptidoglycan-associated protein
MSSLSTKFLPPFLGFATLTWIVGGTYWYKNQFCDLPVLTSNIVAVKNTGTHLPFYFPYGESQPVFTSESFLIFKETTDFLNDNRDKTLVINGLSDPKEAFNNLGLERAKAIKSVLLNLGAIPNSIETKSAQRKNLFFVNKQLIDGVEFNMVDNVEGRFQALNLFFQKDKFQFADNEDLKNYFHTLNQYLSFYPNTQLKITAHRENTEASKKRLDFIRHFLESHDFSPKQITFEDVNSEMPLAEVGNIKNRRVEIRLIVP